MYIFVCFYVDLLRLSIHVSQTDVLFFQFSLMSADFYILMQFSVADDEDLSYYKDQPDRLIDEFKKMKATKKKAEQFAIEAKQSAQKVNLCTHVQPVSAGF